MKKNENKGITLIALIITVIVLLILAGTTVSISINGGHIFGRATTAKEAWNEKVVEEEPEEVEEPVVEETEAEPSEEPTEETENSEEEVETPEDCLVYQSAYQNRIFPYICLQF